MNSPTILNENQVQNFIDYITQKNEVSFNFIRYLVYEWHVNPAQGEILRNLRKVLDVTATSQAILFLLCSKGLGEIGQGKKKILIKH